MHRPPTLSRNFRPSFRAGVARLGLVLDVATLCLLAGAAIMFFRSQRHAGSIPPAASGLDSGTVMTQLVVRSPSSALDTLFKQPGDADRLVFVFRSDCPVCKRQRADWMKLARAARVAGVQVVAVTSEGIGAPEVAEYFDSVPVMQATNPSDIITGLGTSYVPATLVVDRVNHVVVEHVGLMDSVMVAAIDSRWD